MIGRRAQSLVVISRIILMILTFRTCPNRDAARCARGGDAPTSASDQMRSQPPFNMLGVIDVTTHHIVERYCIILAIVATLSRRRCRVHHH